MPIVLYDRGEAMSVRFSDSHASNFIEGRVDRGLHRVGSVEYTRYAPAFNAPTTDRRRVTSGGISGFAKVVKLVVERHWPRPSSSRQSMAGRDHPNESEMLPDSKTASDITVAVPVDIARFRFSAYVDEDQYRDDAGMFTHRVERAIEIVEEMTRLSLKRANLRLRVAGLAGSAASGSGQAADLSGDVVYSDRFRAHRSDGTATAIDTSLWTALPHTEIGSTRIVPVDARGRWRTVDPTLIVRTSGRGAGE